MKPTILVVEDDRSIRNLITVTLEAKGYPFLTAANGSQALLISAERQPDIIFLDLGLPDMDGIEVIRKVRSWSKLPIIVISARSDDDDKVGALDIGADDYITKPFSVEELLARLRVVERRLELLHQVEGRPGEAKEFVDGELRIDYEAHLVYRQGQELHLTPIEYKLLCVLARNAGKVLTRQYILREVWGSTGASESASLRVFMVSLRKKLEAPGLPQYIQTHVGIGYRLLRM
jgi:two-component system KDP operon response regulator KdpE